MDKEQVFENRFKIQNHIIEIKEKYKQGTMSASEATLMLKSTKNLVRHYCGENDEWVTNTTRLIDYTISCIRNNINESTK